jgi:hypothetical protein
MNIADQVVLVATSEAFSTSAPARVAPLCRLRAWVADRCPPVELADALSRAGVVSQPTSPDDILEDKSRRTSRPGTRSPMLDARGTVTTR